VRKSYSEADRIVVIFTKKYGKVSFIAKGVRRLNSKKRGSLEVFSHLKFSAARGKSLDILTEVEIINSFSEIRKDLKKVAIAYFIVEVLGRLTREDEKNERLFKLLLNYLKGLKKETNLKRYRKKYIFEVLTLLGFWPKAKPMPTPDATLREVVERELSSARVGKKILS